MAKPLLEYIKSNYSNLSNTEQKIAGNIINFPQLIPNMTTKELANKASVSEASVTRFFKSIGLDGFSAFKIRLAQELVKKDEYITDFSLLQKKDTPYELFQKVSYVNKGAIDSLQSSMNKKELLKAVEVLKNARKVVFFGVGGSSIAAMDALYKFTKLGYKVDFNKDFHYMLSLIPFLNEKDVFVGISMSGNTQEVIELADFAQSNSATVIAITNKSNSLLNKKADIHLSTPKVEEDFRIGSITSRVAQLTVIDSIYVSLFNLVGERILDKFKDAHTKMLALRRKM